MSVSESKTEVKAEASAEVKAEASVVPEVKESKGLDDEIKVSDAPLSLLCKDGPLPVNRRLFLKSSLIKGALDLDPEGKEIEMKNFDKDVLSHVEKLLEYDRDHPFESPPHPLRSLKMEENLKDKWYATFVDGIADGSNEQKYFFRLIDYLNCMNYLNLQVLLELFCCKAATMVKQKDETALRDLIAYHAPFTEEERKSIENEDRWIEGE